MESVSFPTSDVGVEEMDRALMDLGPLLGVSIKEEVSEESADVLPGAAPVPTSNVEGLPGPLEAKVEHPGAEGEGADSLAPPGARCVLCRQPLALADGVPKLMECLHSACEPCLKAKIDEKMANNMQRDFLGAERITITCPVCRLQCGAANMIEQRFVMEKMESASASAVMDDQRCSSCDDTEPATSYCVDCADFICDSCVTAHQRLKITKDHTIKCKEEAAAELQAASGPRTPHDMFCREHPQERLSLFCETCDRLTCRDCQLQHHRDHKYQFSTEMAAQARASIAALVSEVSYKRVLLGSAMKVIRERQLLIADKKKALVHEITQAVVKLTNAINTRGKQLVLRLNEVCDAKQRTLTEKKEALEQLAGITDHCVEFVSAALRSGSDTAVLHSKRTVQAHLQRIKSRRADIPNPEIPVRISLALDKMPDLIRVVSSIGAIVVDGKVDGGAGAAQGPYHPPQQPQQQQQQQQQPPPQQQQQQQQPLAQAHSAVVALQHAAMHQSFVQGGAGAWPRRLGPLGPLPHGPLRHPHVTSTTHPHHLHGMNEINLRGLLNAGGARALPPRHMPPAHAQAQAMHHAYQQMMGGYQVSGAGRRSAALPRTPSPAPAPPAPAPALARWHTPHLSPHNGGYEAGASTGTTDFKITLGRQHSGGSAPSTPRAALVSSTNPKTPSPSLSLNGSMGGGSGQLGAGALELDKVCAESVQDLMATIAKLDSNGVQVVAEAPSPAPLVHSSTTGAGAGAGADPNEDWCAVCMDGGELMCCDKCPKVFHQYCHIPTIEKVPDETETWQCLLCVNFANLPPEEDGSGALTARAQKLVERITLELYCQYELSLAFREPVPASNHHYHSKISRPMCLDWIRMKLQPGSEERYTHVAQFLQDCRLLFNNAYRYNPPESQIYKDAKRLEEFLDAQLVKWLPEYAYWSGEGPPPNKRPRLD